MNYFLQFLASTFATIGFGFTFSCPKKAIVFGGISGGIAWVIFQVIKSEFDSIYWGNFIGAFTVGILGEFFARKFEIPSSVFIIPAITTLVPGAGMYYTMNYFVQGKQNLASTTLQQTLIIAGILAFGLLISSASSRSLRNFKIRKDIKFDYRKFIKRKEK